MDSIKTALVTGAAKRIGRQIALDLASDGWAVGVHYSSSGQAAQEVVDQIIKAGGKAVAIKADLAEPDSHLQVFSQIKQKLGPICLLVNNASMFEYDDFSSMDIADWDRHQAVNVRAPVFLAQEFASQLPDGQQGNIINIIDQRVWRLNPTFFSYTISKSALWTATQTMAQALAPHIRVNAIGPGPALPSSRMDRAEFDKQCDLVPLKAGTTPQEISTAVRFIVASPSMTGQMIALDGGQHLAWQTPDVVEVKE